MASNTITSAALLITLNLLFFTLVSSTYAPCPPPPKSHKPSPKSPPSAPKSPPSAPKSPPSAPKSPPSVPKSPPSAPKSPPSAPKSPPSAPKKPATCPIDTLNLGACADLLGLVNIVIGGSSNSKCCSLLSGLANLDAAVCLCTAIKANVLGINLNVPVSLSLILNSCGKKLPAGYKCA